MPRGGARKGAGRRSVWNHSETTVIRVPSVFADRLIEIAHKLDNGDNLEFVTKSKVEPIAQLGLLDADDAVPGVVPVRADGCRWLTTSQAYKRAAERGCSRNKNGFKGWSQRSPDDCLEQYGLRRIADKSPGNLAPGYEDMRWIV